jgi:hypothetical protein
VRVGDAEIEGTARVVELSKEGLPVAHRFQSRRVLVATDRWRFIVRSLSRVRANLGDAAKYALSRWSQLIRYAKPGYGLGTRAQ